MSLPCSPGPERTPTVSARPRSPPRSGRAPGVWSPKLELDSAWDGYLTNDFYSDGGRIGWVAHLVGRCAAAPTAGPFVPATRVWFKKK